MHELVVNGHGRIESQRHVLAAHLLASIQTISVSVDATRNRQVTAVEDNTYKVLIKMCKNEFDVPVKDRTSTEKAAVVRFWRNKDHLSVEKVNGEEKLLYHERVVLKKSEIQNLVRKDCRRCKSIGSRKLKHRLNKQFQGISEPGIQKVLSRSKLNQRLKVRFTNKVIVRQIRARDVQVKT